MCLACIEGELWAAYQSEMATRAAATSQNDEAPQDPPQDPATLNGEFGAAHAGSTSAPAPRAGATEPIRT
jgi:hypothetical protein